MELQLQKLTQKFEQPPFVSFNTAIALKSQEQVELDLHKEAYFRSGGKVTAYDSKCAVVTTFNGHDFRSKNSPKLINDVSKRDTTSLRAHYTRNKSKKICD